MLKVLDTGIKLKNSSHDYHNQGKIEPITGATSWVSIEGGNSKNNKNRELWYSISFNKKNFISGVSTR